MKPMTRTIGLKVLAVIASTALVTGCGGDGDEQQVKKRELGVVMSAAECADIYSIDIEKCHKAIEKAVDKHESSSTKYNREHKCEEAEGPQRCERAGQKDFSRRLQAFLIGVSDPPLAAPLYPTTDQQEGFLRADGTEILLDQDEIKFSDQAALIAESNGNLPAKASGGGGGL